MRISVFTILSIALFLSRELFSHIIFVKLESGQTRPFEVEPITTIAELKILIHDNTGIHIEDQFLYFNEVLLEDAHDIGYYNLVHNSTVFLYNSPLPVELISFCAYSKENLVCLAWSTSTELNNFGFEIERKSLNVETGHALSPQNPTYAAWDLIGFVSGAGNSNSVKEYSFIDKDIKRGKYQYRLKQIDNDGTFTFSEVIEVDIALPTQFRLEQNYPNPFNPTTTIEYQIPVNSHVILELYSITGEKVTTLIDSELEAGYYLYSLDINRLNIGLATGVYIYRLTANEVNTNETYSFVRKMMFMK